MTKHIHLHRCADCGKPFPCSDDYLERNYDGWPEIVCVANPCDTEICDACVEQSRGGCDVCGESASIAVEDADDASGYRGDKLLCESCADVRRRA